MVVYCFIEGCKSTKYKSVKDDSKVLTFFGFPTNPVLREKWIEALISSGHNQDHVAKISKCSRICSLHFSKDCIETIGFSCGRLKPNSVPTIFPNASKENKTDIKNADIKNAGSSNMSPVEIKTAKCEDKICPKKQTFMEETVPQHENEICQAPSKKQTSIEIKSIAEDKVQTPEKQTSMKTETIAQYEDEICQTSSKNQSSMEIETVVQSEDEIYHTSSKEQTSMETETVAEHKNEICQAPSKKQPSTEIKIVQSEDEIYQGFSKKRIYYAGDINLRNVENMTPKMLVKSLNILKKSCEKKDKIINRLRAQHCCQKKKIESLEALLSKFREKNIRSQIS